MGKAVNIDSFLAELKAEGEAAIQGAVSTIVRKIAFDTTRDLILATPVGNPSLWQSEAPEGYVGGHARRNWQVTVGAPAESELPGVDMGGQDTEQAAIQVLKDLPPYPVVFITNNVPYIQRLNEGHSTQAPEGFIDAIVDRQIQQLEAEVNG